MRRRALRLLFVTAGALCIALALIGVVVPLLPTTPFLLLASACFVRGSERLHRRLMAQPTLGPYLRDFEAGLGVPVRAKRVAIAMVAGSVTVSAVLVGRPEATAGLLVIGIAVSAYLWRLPTRVASRDGAAAT